MCMCNYKSVFINKLSILKFDANPCRLGHGSFHKNLMHTVLELVLSPGLEETMSFLPFILSQKLDEIMQGFFFHKNARKPCSSGHWSRSHKFDGTCSTDYWFFYRLVVSPLVNLQCYFLHADSVTLRLVITNHGVIICSSQQSQFPFNILWV